MIDYIQHFKKNVLKITPVLNSYGFQIKNEYYPEKVGEFNLKSYEFDFSNLDKLINLNISITKFNKPGFLLLFNLYNKKENEQTYKWRSFYLNEYIDDNNLQSSFIYKIDIDDKVEEFIDQYFKNLEFALNDYLKPYVTGEKYIDHYVKMMDDYYAQTSALQMQQEIINQHLAKQGKMAIFRQMVIGLKQDVRNYMDKVKNFFLPPNLR